ncbi:MAG: AraC family transcriptional regulator [Puniceicoccaceae bacterium]|nr:MAG: AraC family transcriptional regulator [Puniceicoccaceae bacterium]
MLRYLASGPKDFAQSPMVVSTRFNWEFYANLTGRLRPTLPSGRAFSLSGPRLWLFAPQTAHGWESTAEMERVVFHFSSVPDILHSFWPACGYMEVRLKRGEIDQLRELAASLEPHYRAPTPASFLLFQRAVLDLCLILLRDRQFDPNLPLETVAVERVERAIQWYLGRLEERPTLDAVADAVHISPAHLRRQFHYVYGKSPHAVLTHLRLEKAMEMLGSTTDKLEVIARKSGFNSASDLCRVFHRQHNVYPKVWRAFVSGEEREVKDDQIRRIIARGGSSRNVRSHETSTQTVARPKSAAARKPARTRKV